MAKNENNKRQCNAKKRKTIKDNAMPKKRKQ